jgi:hypothetical protein
VASHLGIPIEFVAGDDLEQFGPDWDTADAQYPEPAERGLPLPAVLAERMGAHGRVVFCGEGGDETVSAPYRYFHLLLREHRYLRFVADYFRDSMARPGFRLWKVWPRLFLQAIGPSRELGKGPHEMPDWIQPGMVEQLGLQSRWDRFWNEAPSGDSRIPRGYRAMSSWLLPDALADFDRTADRGGLEYRFPFLDLRVIKTAWSTPTIPHRYYKFLLREPTAEILPGAILARPKRPLAGDPLRCDFESLAGTWRLTQAAKGRFSAYCSGSRPPRGGIQTEVEAHTSVRFYELASWLRYRLLES